VAAYLKFRLEAWRMDKLFTSKFMVGPSHAKPVKEELNFFSYRFRTYFQSNVLYNISIVIIAFAYRIYVNWMHQEKISKDLENQRLKAELSFLKMQINPHFLFNALNNIYSLIVIDHSERAGNSIMKLSEIMRYVLYEKEDAAHKVSLDKEINQLNNYIDLERLRHGDNMHFNFSVEGEIIDKRIAPLLLFPILENAFKHGLLSDPEKPVTAELKVDNQIHFLVRNFKTNYCKDGVGGIGVKNVSKRLDLIYNDRYTFDIQETENEFIVSLALPL
jgi:LytS/YehU family sensor histidine kinase